MSRDEDDGHPIPIDDDLDSTKNEPPFLAPIDAAQVRVELRLLQERIGAG